MCATCNTVAVRASPKNTVSKVNVGRPRVRGASAQQDARGARQSADRPGRPRQASRAEAARSAPVPAPRLRREGSPLAAPAAEALRRRLAAPCGRSNVQPHPAVLRSRHSAHCAAQKWWRGQQTPAQTALHAAPYSRALYDQAAACRAARHRCAAQPRTVVSKAGRPYRLRCTHTRPRPTTRACPTTRLRRSTNIQMLAAQVGRRGQLSTVAAASSSMPRSMMKHGRSSGDGEQHERTTTASGSGQLRSMKGL